jgi:hypothetical protein
MAAMMAMIIDQNVYVQTKDAAAEADDARKKISARQWN